MHRIEGNKLIIEFDPNSKAKSSTGNLECHHSKSATAIGKCKKET